MQDLLLKGRGNEADCLINEPVGNPPTTLDDISCTLTLTSTSRPSINVRGPGAEPRWGSEGKPQKLTIFVKIMHKYFVY